MKTFYVWYMKPDWFRKGSLGGLPDATNLEASHTFLKSIKADNLEDVFMQMQGDFWSPNGEAMPLIEQKGLMHTSMSVGDLAIEHSPAGVTVWMVASVGWKKVS